MVNLQNNRKLVSSQQDLPIMMETKLAKSAGAVEYTDCTSAEGYPLLNESPG